MAGLRVVRGPDWKWENQDGSEGQVGTATGKRVRDGWIHILWDLGRAGEYRSGAQDCCDLLVLDNGPAGVFHPGVTCDACREDNIRGIRWKCADCPDYDLCTECYGNDKHDCNHRFKRRNTPKSSMQNVGRRKNAVKLQSRGLYRGATVVRGQDWDKGNQDGGADNTGTVTKVGYMKEGGQSKACLVAQWNNKSLICRRGFAGKVDVKCKITTIGWSYYRDHLPQLRDTSEFVDRTLARQSSEADETANLLEAFFGGALGGGLGGTIQMLAEHAKAKREATMKNFKVGDSVRLHHDKQTVQRLQDGHGGFDPLMTAALGEVGVVYEIDIDGDLKVKFGFFTWTLNPAAVTKLEKVSAPKPAPKAPAAKPTVTNSTRQTTAPQKEKNLNEVASGSRFRVGDQVHIDHDIDFVKRSQIGHGGWNDDMKKDVKLTGTVKEIDGDGDVNVQFGSRTWTLNPEVLHKVKVNSSKQEGKDKNVNKNVNETPTKTDCISVGDCVTLDERVDIVKKNQDGHGGWSDDMLKVLHEVGVVESMDEDGDLKVKFGDISWLLNPKVCHKAETVRPKKKDVNTRVEPSSECHFKPGDKVKMINDLERVRNLQIGHGGWNNEMKEISSVVGNVLEVDPDGDVRVDFEGRSWILNPAVLNKYTPPKEKDVNATKDVNIRREKEVNMTDSASSQNVKVAFSEGEQVKINVTQQRLKELQEDHGGCSQGLIKAIGQIGLLETIDEEGCLHVDFPNGKFIVNPDACVSLNPDKNKPLPSEPGLKTKFIPGDCVKFASEINTVKQLQDGHGGWNAAMNVAVGKVGAVSEVLPSGDIKVKFGDNCWTFNPEAFMLVDEGGGSKPIPSPRKGSKPTPPPKPGMQRESVAKYRCSICLDKGICVVFNCGHGTCDICSKSIDNCHICRQPIALRTKMFL